MLSAAAAAAVDMPLCQDLRLLQPGALSAKNDSHKVCLAADKACAACKTHAMLGSCCCLWLTCYNGPCRSIN
jgi:hypothetical protein